MSDEQIISTDEATGVVLKIVLDATAGSEMDPTSPKNDEAMNDVRFVVLHRRYQNPAEQFGLTSVEEVAAFEEANQGPDSEWFHVPLFLYDHSGTVYRAGEANPFHCPWDSGRVGLVAYKRATWGDGTDATLRGYIDNLCERYTAWANGECYGFVIEDADGEQLDSCWGYLGTDEATEAGKENLPYYVEEAAKAKASDEAKQAAADARQSELADRLRSARNVDGLAIWNDISRREDKPELAFDPDDIIGRLNCGTATVDDLLTIIEQHVR